MLHQDNRSQRPVIGSLTSANAEFNHWLKQNQHTQLPDASGQIWTLKGQVQIFPDPVNLHAAVHRLSFELKTEISRQILLKRGVLDASKDQRLLSLLDDSIITVLYQRAPFETDSADKIRTQAAEDLIKIRNAMKSVDLGKLYRATMGRWVDKQFHMTYPPLSSYQIKIDLAV
ncbi:MAG: hypothetical protein H7249_17280 [Chitinophagaceae bacterium]|nr:hypothetical protein [Oligoflexus sp.]